MILYIFCPTCLSGIQCWSEAPLPSFTVKCLADWKGHFSNRDALPLIFCLSSGVRLIYHASSPADIQIHFDWQLDWMTPTTTNVANITMALTDNVLYCILNVSYTVNICTHSQAHTQTKWITVVLCWPLFSALLVCKCGIEFIEQRGQTAALLLFSHLTNSIIW